MARTTGKSGFKMRSGNGATPKKLFKGGVKEWAKGRREQFGKEDFVDHSKKFDFSGPNIDMKGTVVEGQSGDIPDITAESPFGMKLQGLFTSGSKHGAISKLKNLFKL
tara:strand:+ start:1146 stop:1469 length:324 start_codon:yes stop_codon:yes gene_type:complete